MATPTWRKLPSWRERIPSLTEGESWNRTATAPADGSQDTSWDAQSYSNLRFIEENNDYLSIPRPEGLRSMCSRNVKSRRRMGRMFYGAGVRVGEWEFAGEAVGGGKGIFVRRPLRLPILLGKALGR